MHHRPLDPRAAVRVLDTALALKSLMAFVRLAWPIVNGGVPLQENWHVTAIAEHLQAVTDGEIKKLIILAPPRSLKSQIVSVFWPVWGWLRRPRTQWIYISYDDLLAERDAVRSRDLLRLPWFTDTFAPSWKLKADADAKNLYKNTAGGMRVATTPGGLGTGFDADICVVEDPHPARDARKAARLESVYDWFGKTMATRGNRPQDYARVISMQSLSKQDLAHRLMADRLGYEALVVPMRHNPARVFPSYDAGLAAGCQNPVVPTTVQRRLPATCDPRTTPGQLLQPERFTPEVVKELVAHLRDQASAQLDQDPGDEETAIFHRRDFRYFTIGPSRAFDGRLCAFLRQPDQKVVAVSLDSCACFLTADTALTAKSTSSYTAVGTHLLTPDGELLVFHVFRARLEVTYQYHVLRSLEKSPGVWDAVGRRFIPTGRHLRRPLFLAVEPKASGIGLIQQSAADGRPFRTLKVDGDKVERAGPLASLYYQGKVYHLEGADWLPDFEEELLAFDQGLNNDQVDQASHAALLAGHDQILRGVAKQPLVYNAVPTDEEADALLLPNTARIRTSAGVVEIEFPDD